MIRIFEKLAIREFWMFTIAGLGMAVLGLIAVLAIERGVPRDAAAIVGAVVTGILLRIGDVISAIRALWGAARREGEAGPAPGAGDGG